jgi:hypothetical protein
LNISSNVASSVDANAGNNTSTVSLTSNTVPGMVLSGTIYEEKDNVTGYNSASDTAK